jgi:chorismate mutase/prephenate dehydratase
VTGDGEDRAAGREVGAQGRADGPARTTRGSGRRRPVPTEAERRAAAEELGRVRDRIDELDRRIVALLNERARLGRAAGHAKNTAGRRAVRDAQREREVLLRVAMANEGPLSQADLLSIYRRIVAATRGLEHRDRTDGGPAGR